MGISRNSNFETAFRSVPKNPNKTIKSTMESSMQYGTFSFEVTHGFAFEKCRHVTPSLFLLVLEFRERHFFPKKMPFLCNNNKTN